MALFDPIELEGIRYYRVEDNHLYVAFHSNETDVCYLTAEHLFPHDPPGEVVRLIGCQEQSGYAANTVKLREDLVEYLKYLQEIYYAYKVRHLSLTILVDSDSWLSTEFFLDIDKDFPGIAVTDIGKLNFEELKNASLPTPRQARR